MYDNIGNVPLLLQFSLGLCTMLQSPQEIVVIEMHQATTKWFSRSGFHEVVFTKWFSRSGFHEVVLHGLMRCNTAWLNCNPLLDF